MKSRKLEKIRTQKNTEKSDFRKFRFLNIIYIYTYIILEIFRKLRKFRKLKIQKKSENKKDKESRKFGFF